VVVRTDIERERNRLDAEIVVGGRLGPCEAVVMRMYGRLALHAESVVMPLLVPDVPVVTWWHGEPPQEIATDFLGVVADRRITDAAQAADPIAALRQRARDYAPGDTDLAWTRITPWRTLVAGAFDTAQAKVTEATVVAPKSDPTAALMRGWLAARLGIDPTWEPTDQFPRMREVQLRCANGDELSLTRNESVATFRRTGQEDRALPLVRRPLGDELAEELRRLDADQVYAEALGTAAGLTGLDERPAQRVHVWKDPATAQRAEAGVTAHAGATATE
jgi:glucose-6-phosphate dehydrogenase assembly protein OpcA